MSKTKLTIEQKFDLIRKEAKETYNLLVEQTKCFEDLMDEEDLDWKDDLVDELHRIRKALKPTLKHKDKKTKEVSYSDRPTTAEYLLVQVKKLKNVSKDMEELFAPFDADTDEE